MKRKLFFIYIADDTNENNDEWNDEIEAVEYNYSLFHLFFCIATFYVCAILTRWTK